MGKEFLGNGADQNAILSGFGDDDTIRSMVLRVPISPKTEAKLKAKAAALGLDVESYASQQLEAIARRPTLEELSGPIAKAFEESGMTEDELAEFLEQEKHAMRAERRAKRAP